MLYKWFDPLSIHLLSHTLTSSFQHLELFAWTLWTYSLDICAIIKNSGIYMEFRKMVTITLCTRQQQRHWCIEQSYGLCWRGRRWEDLGEWHWNMYNIMYEMSCQSRFNAQYWMLGAGALGRPRGMVWGGRRVQDGEHMYTCGRFI